MNEIAGSVTLSASFSKWMELPGIALEWQMGGPLIGAGRRASSHAIRARKRTRSTGTD